MLQKKPIIAVTLHTTDQTFEANRSYIEAIKKAGGVPICIPNLPEEDAIEALQLANGVLIIGGQDIDPVHYDEEPHPKLGAYDNERDEADLAVVDAALEMELPILAVCRGLQVLNVALGGTLYQDIEAEIAEPLAHQQTTRRTALSHHIELYSERLQHIIGQKKIRVNSMHHQAIADLAEDLAIGAMALDGVIEAVVHKSQPYCIGVQWHPEELSMVDDPFADRLFKSFIEACL